MLTEIKQAIRELRRGAGPLVVGMLSLSLGIMATATMLGVVDAIDLRPLPFHQPDRLVDLSEMDASRPDDLERVSPGVYSDWRDRIQSIASLSAASAIAVSFEGDNTALRAARVTHQFFSSLGVEPILGRVFGSEEIRNAERVVVISHEVWLSRFGGDPGAIGRTIPLSWAGEFRSVPSEPYVIVGVLGPTVQFPRGTRVWIPAAGGFGDSREDAFLTVTGRLADGESLSTAQAELRVVASRLAADFPEAYEGRLVKASSIRDAMRASVDERGAGARLPLLGVATFVLLLTVLNVAGLFLARAASQLKELRTRLALGASRRRLAIHLLAQSSALSLAAGVIGIGLSHGIGRAVAAKLEIAQSGAALALDHRFVLFALLISLGAGVLAAVLPIWKLFRLESEGPLGNVSARGTGLVRTGIGQKAIVIAQVAFAVVLLSGSGLLGAELLRLFSNDIGLDPDRLLVASLPINMTSDSAVAIEEAGQIKERVRQVGGIASVALGGRPAEAYGYKLKNGKALNKGTLPMSYRVSPGYFATLGIGLISGREFAPADSEGAPAVGIVNRMAAESWWPDQSAIGRQIFMGRGDGTGDWVEVVGVAENEKVIRNMTWKTKPVLYRPFDQLTHERRRTRLFARTEVATETLFGSVSAVIDEMSGGDGWRGQQIHTMKGLLGRSLVEQRFRAWALSAFAAVALFLAGMGIYGIVATMTSQRAPELGVRIALGARPIQLLLLVSRQGLVLAAIGFLIGTLGAFGLAKVFRSLLVEASGFDWGVHGIAGLTLVVAVFAACFFPAKRAKNLDAKALLQDL